MTYIDRLKYEQYEQDPDKFIKVCKVVNFGIIYNRGRWDRLHKTIKEYQIVATFELV